jgi:hypothetical protein
VVTLRPRPSTHTAAPWPRCSAMAETSTWRWRAAAPPIRSAGLRLRLPEVSGRLRWLRLPGG